MKKQKKEKGITLIALIITIIIMLILVGVSVSVSLNGGLFETAERATKETQIAADKEQLVSMASGSIGNNGKVEISKLDDIILSDKNFEGTGGIYTSKESGKTYIVGTDFSITLEGEKVVINPSKEEYGQGDLVSIGNEKFYVLADDGEKLILLARDCISTSTLVQSANAEMVRFSETNYWASDFTENPFDLIEDGEPDTSHYAAHAAYKYGKKLGGKGRLMTYDEAYEIEDLYDPNDWDGVLPIQEMLYGRNGKSSNEYLNYWLSSAYAETDLYYVYGRGYTVQASPYDSIGYDGIIVNGVRPVVEILRANIKK